MSNADLINDELLAYLRRASLEIARHAVHAPMTPKSIEEIARRIRSLAFDIYMVKIGAEDLPTIDA